MHTILIVGDGMADRPLRELDYKTPLEASNPENLHRIASKGISGLLDPIALGTAPSSDAANLAILGYDPCKVYTGGRGPFEASGAGIKVGENDVAFRCNFATLNENLVVVDQRAGRIRDEAKPLGEVLQEVKLKENSDVEVVFRQTLGFKGALVLRGEKLSSNVSTEMAEIGSRADSVKPLDSSSEASRTANVLNEYIRESYSILKDCPINEKRRLEGKHSANAVIPWSGGKLPLIESFYGKYELRGACVAAVSLIKGIARLSGMITIDVPGATGDLDTDTLAKADAAIQAVKNNDFVLVHVEAPDEASHEGNIMGKIGIIKKIDSMVGAIIDHVDLDDVTVVLLADHVTSTKLRKHTGDSVPIAIASTEVAKDGVNEYSERAAYKGGLNRIQGRQVMPLIMNLMGKPQRIGGRLT